MIRTLYVIAHRAGARLMFKRGQLTESIETIDHPEGRLRDGDRDADRPGRTHDSGGVRHALGRRESPVDHIATTFARAIAARMTELRLEKRYDAAILVAEPAFLGVLRDALDDPTAATVRGSITKDLSWVDTQDLATHLANPG